MSQVRRIKYCFKTSLCLAFFWSKTVHLHNFDHSNQNLFGITNIQMLMSTGAYSGQMKPSTAWGGGQDGVSSMTASHPLSQRKEGRVFFWGMYTGASTKCKQAGRKKEKKPQQSWLICPKTREPSVTLIESRIRGKPSKLKRGANIYNKRRRLVYLITSTIHDN